MHKEILSELERKRMRSFIRADGEKMSAIRGMSTRCRQNLPQITEDLALIREFLERYAHEKRT